MSRTLTAESMPRIEADSLRLRSAVVLSKVIFVSLIALFIVTAIPYGTAEAWWKALFVCTVFALTILWTIEGLLSGSWISGDWSLALPILALAAFAFFQTLPLTSASAAPAGLQFPLWNAISADPYQTRFFALQLLSLMLAGLLLIRYAASERRLRIVITVIICLAVASALFGIIRQTAQQDIGFGIPLIKPSQGYAQFINKNHFAFLMEMALGLTLGLILYGGIKRERLLVYVAALLPIWTALVLCGSRGGLIAMLAQVLTAALLFGILVGRRRSADSQSKLVRLAVSLPVRLVLVAILGAGVVFGTLWLGGDRLASSLEKSRDEFSLEGSETRSGASRGEIWQVTWKMFAANPIAGVGLGGYWTAVPAYHDAAGSLRPFEAHNDYLEILASGGLIGAAIVVWFAVMVLARTRKNLRSPNRFRRAACYGAAIGIAGVAVHSLVDFGLHILVNALVFTTLIVIATSKLPWADMIREREL